MTNGDVPEVVAPATVVAPVSEDAASRAALVSADAAVLRTEGSRAAAALLANGQRRINMIWEISQAAIALMVVATTCVAIFMARVFGVTGPDGAFPPEWWTILGLVIGFYFGRTNHARVGDPTVTEVKT